MRGAQSGRAPPVTLPWTAFRVHAVVGLERLSRSRRSTEECRLRVACPCLGAGQLPSHRRCAD